MGILRTVGYVHSRFYAESNSTNISMYLQIVYYNRNIFTLTGV